MEEKQGIVAHIIFRNDDNGYTVGIMETETEYFTIVGFLPACRKGMEFILRGSFKVHPTYGEQFAFTEFEEVMPTGTAAIEGFLASDAIRGVGPKMASLIVKEFGEDTLHVLEKTPERLTEISGIGEKKTEIIRESYMEYREFADISIKLQGMGISPEYALKLYNLYGVECVDLIAENPYRLTEDVFGIGFRKADAIAQKMGMDADNPYRIKSGIKYTMMYFIGEGNTYLPEKVLSERAANLLDVSIELIEDAVVELAFSGDIQIDTVDDEKAIYIFSYYQAEQEVCKNLGLLSRGALKALTVDVDSMIEITENTSGIKLSDGQKTAVKNSLFSGISVITGGPGTGKTTIINTLINIFEQSGCKVAIAAPTGRAAKRITETSGHYASTIHRMLEYYYAEAEDTMRFGKNSEEPLDYDVVLVDEASMIDLMLMKGLTDAIKPGTRLILVGDCDQLPSVGAGNVLKDIIDSEFVQTMKLTEIFRQAVESMIVVNAHRINRGEYPYLNEEDKDFFFMRRINEDEISELISDLVTHRLPGYYDGINPMKDIQVLTPVKKGKIGCAELNKRLQQSLNPHNDSLQEKVYGDKVFRTGDKVMQIRNNYRIGWRRQRDFAEGEGIFNGDVGFIQSIDKEYGQMTVAFDDDRYVTYEFSQLDELELAYAVTVHKSQGSEFPIVVMPAWSFPPMLATRNLLYTAVTRGKKAVVIVGSEGRLNAMVDNNSIKSRYSGLKYRLQKMVNNGL